MRYVFVETNWVVGYAAPAHQKIPAAIELLEQAASGQIKLYLPAICVSEARRPVFERFQVRSEADRIRQFLLWGKDAGIVSNEEDATTRRVLDRMEARVKTDLEQLDEVLGKLKAAPGLEIFDLSQDMLQRCTELSFQKLGLEPFDQAILAGVLVRAEILRKEGVGEMAFCELDSHLQPWDKNSNRKDRLADLYDAARVWVYGDFLLQAPEKPADWPARGAA